MSSSMRRFCLLVLLLAALLLAVGCSSSQSAPPKETAKEPPKEAPKEPPKEPPFPNQPITFICGSGVGGATDTMMRGIMPYFEKYIGVSVKAENREGAHGLIAANYVFKSKPDGYTLFIMNNPYAMQIIMSPDKEKTGLKSLLDFVPVASWLNADGNAIAVRLDSPYKTVDDLAAAAKKKALPIATASGSGWAGSKPAVTTTSSTDASPTLSEPACKHLWRFKSLNGRRATCLRGLESSRPSPT
ncbi:MAG: tripartite tricarboxylate transporter substrate-binding protein, partial [Firmicutes bacterium]|nr:tripartite tricarboxylate transporter substrate-binding protein [Bacillota bacterium]